MIDGYILSIIFLVVWAVSVIYSLLKMSRLGYSRTEFGIWTLVILLIPYLGVLAFLISVQRKPLSSSR